MGLENPFQFVKKAEREFPSPKSRAEIAPLTAFLKPFLAGIDVNCESGGAHALHGTVQTPAAAEREKEIKGRSGGPLLKR